ncbi:short-chain dehydrogenase [Rhodococcus sp. SC4]|nr:short-chain dehydrogenase [Rhodococcus sp. SC4]
MNRLHGKTAVVTGGTTGIGLSSARALARAGARVVVIGRRDNELQAAVEAIGPTALGVRGDVTDQKDLGRLFDVATSDGNRVDVVVANAGIGTFARIEEISEQHIDRTFDVNVKAAINTVQTALGVMNDGGAIVMMSSTAAHTGTEGLGVYAASKAAVRSLARTWSNELKSRGIRVNTIAPGPVDTPGLETLAGGGASYTAFKRQQSSRIPMGRTGTADEVADAVVFLASSESSFITGANLCVDGGLTQL